MKRPDWCLKSMGRRVARSLSNHRRCFSDFLFPWECVLCGGDGPELDGPLCTSCYAKVLDDCTHARSLACPRCALPVGPFAASQEGCTRCHGRFLGFDAATTLGLYEGPMRDLCLLLKRERNAWLASWLGRLMVQVCEADLIRLPSNTWVVPVPLYWARYLKRGYNQAEALARTVAHHLGFKLQRPLRRIKPTGYLSAKSLTQRMAAMHGVFQVRHPEQLRDRTILLIDDILTTGATCGAASRVLKQAGARYVLVAVLGRAV
jgi:ComF family protein